MRNKLSIVIAVLGVVLAPAAAWAVSYASGIQNLGGGNYSFVLNEASSGTKIQRTGDTQLDLGALSKGTHTFNIGSGTAFDIKAYTSTAPGWTKISNDADNASKYYTPKGVAVNQNAASPYFGRIYVGESRGGTTAGVVRTTTDGLYIMGADQSDVTAQGNAAWTGGVSWTTDGTQASSPFKLSIAPDDSIYLADWSDTHSGVWRSNPNGSGTFDEILDNTGRTATGLVAGLHGSVPATYVEGTGANTKLYTLDEDYNAGSSTGSILRYDIGTATNYNIAPVEETEDDTAVIANLRADLVRDEDGSWWVAQYRSTETAGVPALTRWLPGGQAPVYNSGVDNGLAPLLRAYGNLDIHNGLDLLAVGARSGAGIYILDISNPNAPVLLATIAQTGYAQDVAFDAAGNLYVMSSSTETLRIWSPGGSWKSSTSSDGSFTLVPEPATLALLAMGALSMLRRRR